MAMECSCKVVVSVVKGKVAKLNVDKVQKLGVNPYGTTATPEDVMLGKTFYAGNTDKKVGTYDPNIEIMKGVDLTEINHDGGYELGSERNYVEADAEFQYWANIIMYGQEEPYEKPDLPTLQTKVVEPRLDDFEVKADTGYELEKVVVKGVTAKIDSNIKPENIKQGETILGVVGSVIERLPVKEENIMIMKITDRALLSLGSNMILASEEDYSQSEDRIQYWANIILNGGANV